MIDINQCLCLPKAELNTKNSTKWQLCCRLVEFMMINSIHKLISIPSDEVYRVCDGGPDYAVFLHMWMALKKTKPFFNGVIFIRSKKKNNVIGSFLMFS